MSEDELEEAAKPDFLDLDKDGDKEESMKDAAEDAKEDKKEDDKEEKDLSKVPPQLRKHVAKKLEESIKRVAQAKNITYKGKKIN